MVEDTGPDTGDVAGSEVKVEHEEDFSYKAHQKYRDGVLTIGCCGAFVVCQSNSRRTAHIYGLRTMLNLGGGWAEDYQNSQCCFLLAKQNSPQLHHLLRLF